MSGDDVGEVGAVSNQHWNDSARKLLESHGYGFQFAIQKAFSKDRRDVDWWCAAAEFPVTVRGEGIHIDLVLQYRGELSDRIGTTILIAAECKRVDASRACWLFARAPYLSDVGRVDDLFVDAVTYPHVFNKSTFQSSGFVHPGLTVPCVEANKPFHLGLEMKTPGKSDGTGTPQPINNATGQALRSASGLVNHFTHHETQGRVIVIPAVFTTATLRVTDANLADADLLSGKPSGPTETKVVPWLWLNVNRSLALKHERETQRVNFPEFRIGSWSHPQEYCRSVMVISADGIERFKESRVGALVAGAWISEWNRIKGPDDR